MMIYLNSPYLVILWGADWKNPSSENPPIVIKNQLLLAREQPGATSAARSLIKIIFVTEKAGGQGGIANPPLYLAQVGFYTNLALHTAISKIIYITVSKNTGCFNDCSKTPNSSFSCSEREGKIPLFYTLTKYS